MTLVAGLDFETSGLSEDTDRIIEIGSCLWDWEKQIPLMLLSELVFHDGLTLTDEIVRITGITDEMLRDYGRLEDGCIVDLNAILSKADHVLAHFGAEFDRKFYEATCTRTNYESVAESWIDTSIDIVYPENIKTRNLRHLAAEHGFLMPFGHRAVFDVLGMLKIASCYSLDAMVARSREPIIYLQAIVSYDDREKAKERKYQWYGARKIWWKALKQSDVMRERSEAPFDTSLLPWTERPEEAR